MNITAMASCLHLLFLSTFPAIVLCHLLQDFLITFEIMRREVRDIMTAEHCLGRVQTGRTGIIMTQEQRGHGEKWLIPVL